MIYVDNLLSTLSDAISGIAFSACIQLSEVDYVAFEYSTELLISTHLKMIWEMVVCCENCHDDSPYS